MKLNTLLAKTDHTESVFKKGLEDYISTFKKGTKFKGHRKEYLPRDGMMDDPGQRSFSNVEATVDENLKWFEETNAEHIDNIFSLEATNAAGALAPLIVEGVYWGTFSSLELLRLKSLLESGELKNMYEHIPVRDEAKEWEVSTSNGFNRPGIYMQPPQDGVAKSIRKETIILHDPNPGADKRPPVTGVIDHAIELGDYKRQEFSGEWSPLQRAELLRRRSRLLNAVIEALKVANETETISSQLNAENLFNYLHRGTSPVTKDIDQA